MTDRLDELADRLDTIADEIAEAAIDALRSALQRGEAARPAVEKRLTQSRRAVEKASHLLRTATDGATASDEFD